MNAHLPYRVMHGIDSPVLVLDEKHLQPRERGDPLPSSGAHVVLAQVPYGNRIVDDEDVELREIDRGRQLAEERKLPHAVAGILPEGVKVIRYGGGIRAMG